MLAVVLAAGRGRRLQPLTKDRSKAMLPIAGAPMIERVLDQLAAGGATRFIVVAHPGMLDLLSGLRRSPWADRIQPVYQDQRLGTAHALECAKSQIRGRDAILVASCDNLYPEGHVAALIERQRQDKLDAALTLIAVTREEAPSTAIAFIRDDRVRRIVEKPNPEELPPPTEPDRVLGVPCLYALSTHVLDYLPRVPISTRGERELPDALQLWIEDGGRVAGQPVETRMTLTGPDDLLAINRHVVRSEPLGAAIQTHLPANVKVLQPVHIDPDVAVAAGCEIGPEVCLETGCSLGAGAVVRHAVVLQGGYVEAGQTVENAVIAQDPTM